MDRIIYTSTKKSLLSTSFLCLWFKMAKLSIQQSVAQIIGEISSKVKPRLSQAADLGAVWGLSPHWMLGKERQDDLGPGNSLSFSSSESQGIWMRTSARVKPWFSWRWGHCCYSSSLQDKTHGMNTTSAVPRTTWKRPTVVPGPGRSVSHWTCWPLQNQDDFVFHSQLNHS